MNRVEHPELMRMVDELLQKGFLRKSLSPYVVPASFTPKDGRYVWIVMPSTESLSSICFFIPSLDDLWDMMTRSHIFSKIDHRS